MHYTASPAVYHFQRAAHCYQQMRYVEAIQHYLDGLKLDADRHYIYADLAKTYEMLGKWDSALACIETALQLSPDSQAAHRRKERLLEEKQCYETLISHSGILQNLEFPPPEFLSRLQKERTSGRGTQHHSQWSVALDRFNLTCDAAMNGQTVWYISRLIQQIDTEIGGVLKCYPSEPVSVRIINKNRTTVSRLSMPQWASGCFDGQIQITYYALAEPVLGVLYSLLRHEWVHLLIHQKTCFRCPIWLDEGLAQCLARPMLKYEQDHVKQYSQNGYLLPPDELSQPFSQMPTKKRKLAYLQSRTIVGYLIQQFGFAAIRRLLSQIGNGVHVETAIDQTFAMSLAEIQKVAVS